MTAASVVPMLRAPFPWFGGKSRASGLVWRALGNVPNYVEPFAGSLAVLLARPHEAKIETVNDRDCYLSNFWRAVTAAPDAVAEACDWPVNEIDLHARHRWLVAQGDFRDRMRADPNFYDARIAGWWVWGLSMWIGGGWCEDTEIEFRRPQVTASSAGQGVHKNSVHQKKPDLYVRGHGRGIRAAIPEDGDMSPIVGHPSNWQERPFTPTDAGPPCLEWFRQIRARLRRVRVCCGDWQRVLTDSVIGTTKSRNSGMNPCGILLDPPYSEGQRAMGLYGVDDGAVAPLVAAWAREHGGDPDLRIVLCGYEGEHEMPWWTEVEWKGLRGYGGADNGNRHRERLWLSPHCLPLEDVQASLFGGGR